TACQAGGRPRLEYLKTLTWTVLSHIPKL
ncbi:hypothetical protein CEXT_152151, partial [Caerostris extrusa]